jgi:YVTN family beta-propeller protein
LIQMRALFPISLSQRSHGVLCAVLIATSILLTACRSHDFPEYPSNYREYAYVTNGGSNTVSIFDLVNLRLDRELAVGEHPVAVLANPAENFVYVVNSGNPNSNGSVSVLDAEKNQVVATIPVHHQPVDIAIIQAGPLAYVANSGSNSVSVIDLKANAETAVFGVGEQPTTLTLSPDGKTLAVANAHASSVTLLNASTAGSRSPRAIFEGCPGASHLTIVPDSSKLFAACTDGHQVMVIALAHENQGHQSQPDRLESLLDVGKSPIYLALKPDGGEIFVMNSGSDSISELSTPTDDVLGSYLMGDHPRQGLVSADNSTLYVSNSGSSEVTIYAIDDGKRVGGVHVGDGPSALALSTAGHLLLVVDARSSDVALVRTASLALSPNGNTLHSLFTMLSTGREPNAIAIKAFSVK